MVIFHSYVKLPEGIHEKTEDLSDMIFRWKKTDLLVDWFWG